MQAGEPFAPWLKWASNAPAQVKNQHTPTKEEVGVPAYPKPYISLTIKMTWDKNIVRGLNLVTNDPMDKVLAFYKEKLLKMPDWKWDDTFKTFYQGKSVMETMKKGYGTLALQEITDFKTELDLIYADKAAVSKLKTRTQVSYKAGK